MLLPTESNKLLVQWQGPYEVMKRVAKNDYVIDRDGKDKIYHANLLKKYVERQNDEIVHASACLETICVGVLNDHEYEEVLEEVEFPHVKPKETVQDVHISETCGTNEVTQVKELLEEFKDVLTDVPGKTNLAEYTMKLTTSNPVQSKPYAVPHALRDPLKHEIDEMLRMGVIEKSTSVYASPIVLVPKSDGSLRFCIDYRKLNSITIFDPEPIPNIEDLFTKISTGTWFTKLDLSKGYWQIPVKENDRDKTAFVTTEGGLFQSTVMPFGMVNAPAVFTRMMRSLLAGFDNVVNYIDDCLIFSDTFENHLKDVKAVFECLREVGLTARPSKCFIAYTSLEFLGHVVGEGVLRPMSAKIEAVMKAERPIKPRKKYGHFWVWLDIIPGSFQTSLQLQPRYRTW